MRLPTVGLSISILVAFFISSQAEEKKIRVFVALCDNATQGIVKVNSNIGDGNKPDSNLDQKITASN